jgi:hypothetical protein
VDLLWKEKFDEFYPNRRKETKADAVNRVAIVKGDVVTKNQSIVCLSYVGSGMDYVLCSVQKLGVPKEVAIKYYDWIANRSPYAEAFVSKDAEQIINDAMVVVTSDVDGRIVVGGLMAARAISELHRIPQVWYDLVENGVHENVAFVFAHLLSTDDKCSSIFLKVQGNSNHTAIYRDCESDEYYLNFIHGRHRNHSTLRKENYGYVIQPHWQVEGHPTKLEVVKDFGKWFNNLKVEKVVKGTNPFAPAKSTTRQLNYKDAIKQVAAYLIEGYKGEVND